MWHYFVPRDVVMPAILVPLSRRRRCAAALAILLTGASAPPARADETPPSGMPIRVAYRAPATCPSTGEFLDNVRRYTTKWSLIEEGAADREFVVVLDSAKSGTQGTLEITVGERKSRRVVSGPSCQTVARALAVMVALVIDPAASIAGGPGMAPPTEPAPPPPPPSTRPPESSSAPSRGERDATASRRPVPPAASVEAPRASSPKAPGRRLGFSLELREEVTSAVADRSLIVFGAFVDCELRLFADTEKRTGVSILARPSLGIGGRQSLPKEIGVPGGGIEFLWSAATARLCPLRLRFAGERFEIAPCIEGSAGVLQTESHGIPLAQATSKRWFDAGASLLGVWRLAGPWIATVSVSLVAPLTRYRFEAVDLGSSRAALRSELVSQAPALGMAVGFGLGLRL